MNGIRKIAVGQAGGPTAVINASLLGLIDGLYKDSQIYAIKNGYQGLVEEELELLEGAFFDWVQQHKYVPGCCLGSGRYALTPELMHRAVLNLKKQDIHTLIFIGGNGTMAALSKISEIAKAMNYELQVIGIPKTVDNDLAGTDHAPGFASAARYVALNVRDVSKDLEAMRNFEQVRIIEAMGRNAGWLALASGYYKESELDGPHFIYLPEVKIRQEDFLIDIQNSVNRIGMATVVVSEGFSFAGETAMARQVNGRSVLGDISRKMARLVREQLKYATRSENMGMHQRCATYAISDQDHKEAYEVGLKAAEFVKMNMTDRMVCIERLQSVSYNYKLKDIALSQVAEYGERVVPNHFLSNRTRYYEWLEPIIGEPVSTYPPMWRRGV